MKSNYLKNQLVQFGKISLIALLLCGGKVAVAGERGGNGGDAIVCPGERPVLLDYHEMKSKGLVLDLGDETLSVSEKVDIGLSRIKNFDVINYMKLKSTADSLVKDIEAYKLNDKVRQKITYFTDDVLNDIDDSFEVGIPKGCERAQLVNQDRDWNFRNKQFTINREIFFQMSNDQQALTVLHEAWYSLMLDHGAEDSRTARYFNGYINSEDGREMDFRTYVELIEMLKKKKIDLPLYGKSFHQADNLNSQGKFVRLHTSWTTCNWKTGVSKTLEDVTPITGNKDEDVCLIADQKSVEESFEKFKGFDEMIMLPVGMMFDSKGNIKRHSVQIKRFVWPNEQPSLVEYKKFKFGDAEFEIGSVSKKLLRYLERTGQAMDLSYTPSAHLNPKGEIVALQVQNAKSLSINGKRIKTQQEYFRIDSQGNLILEE